MECEAIAYYMAETEKNLEYQLFLHSGYGIVKYQ